MNKFMLCFFVVSGLFPFERISAESYMQSKTIVFSDRFGETSNENIFCTLYRNSKGVYKEGSYVVVILKIKKTFLNSGVILNSHNSGEFGLAFSVKLEGEQEDDFLKYEFSISNELLEKSQITIFSSDSKIYKMYLGDAPKKQKTN